MAKVVITPPAVADVERIFAYYEALHIGLGQGFLVSFEISIESIATYPLMANTLLHDLSWIRMKKFPYKIVYHYDQDQSTAAVNMVIGHREDPLPWNTD